MQSPPQTPAPNPALEEKCSRRTHLLIVFQRWPNRSRHRSGYHGSLRLPFSREWSKCRREESLLMVPNGSGATRPSQSGPEQSGREPLPEEVQKSAAPKGTGSVFGKAGQQPLGGLATPGP